MKCENCGNEHDGSYGSGRFCSKSCKCSFNGKKCKHFPTKDELKQRKGFGTGRKKSNGWTCSKCGKHFETRAQMRKHIKEVNHPNNRGWARGLTSETNSSIAKQVKTFREHFLSGQIIPHWRGKRLSEKAKENMRKGRVRYLESVLGAKPTYNKSSIPILESIAKEHGWTIQHAENGGEFYTGIGYFVDAYDKERNIVLEYDEPKHYVDKENNILRDEDIERQQRIIAHLGCDFYRYNEKTKTLWKVQ